jgi:2-keto-3-deoxy-galactonokinase
MAGACGDGTHPLFLVGRPDLSALYAVAAGLAGHESIQVDATAAFMAGINVIKDAAA